MALPPRGSGGRFMAMTTGPDRSMLDMATAATGVITACTGAVLREYRSRAADRYWRRYQRGQSLPRRMPAPALGQAPRRTGDGRACTPASPILHSTVLSV